MHVCLILKVGRQITGMVPASQVGYAQDFYLGTPQGSLAPSQDHFQKFNHRHLIRKDAYARGNQNQAQNCTA